MWLRMVCLTDTPFLNGRLILREDLRAKPRPTCHTQERIFAWLASVRIVEQGGEARQQVATVSRRERCCGKLGAAPDAVERIGENAWEAVARRPAGETSQMCDITLQT